MRSSLAVLVLLAACGKRDEPEQKREPNPPRRVIEPLPTQGVRALPPHAIRADGVGPFKLGEPAARLLDQLPSGPRITQFMLPIAQRDILRAEDDAILIGAEPQGKATFVAVLRPEIARTEGGIHVGSSRQELMKSLGGPLDDPDRAQDPRIVIPSGLKNLHCLIENGEITAMVIASEERSKEVIGETACTRPKGDRDLQKLGACLTGAGEIVRYTSDEIQVYAKDTDKLLDRKPVPDLVFAAAVRNPSDGRDDIVTVARTIDSQIKMWSVAVFRIVDNKLMKIVPDTPVFTLTAINARWIGVDLRDVDIYVEVTGRGDTIEVGGLLTAREGDKIRDIVVIPPKPVSRKRTKAPGQDAGTTEARSPGTERAPR